jgi:hypothetical protein
MQFRTDTTTTSTNLVRRPIDGHVYTCSGRLIPQPPWIISHDDVTQSLYEQWLLDQGREEASVIGDDWLIVRLDGMNAHTMTEDVRHLLSDYLFGQIDPRFEARDSLHDF